VGAWNGLYHITGDRVKREGPEGSPIGALCALGAGDGATVLFAAGPSGIWRSEGGGWIPVEGRWNTAIRAIAATADGKLWIGTASGLYLKDLKVPGSPVERLSTPDRVLSSNISGLSVLPDGRVAVASTGGVDLYRGAKRESSLSVPQGLPCRDVRAVASDAKGRLWLATRLGVARYDGRRWSLRHSLRWLGSDDARCLALAPDGTTWVGGASGVDAIRRKRMTLEQKAAYFLDVLRSRHIREPGLVGPAILAAPGDLSHSFIEDDDNDGEHTGMYLAMESMRYAVTHDPAARENARAAFHALELLQRVTGTPHFIARSVLPVETPPRHETDRTFTDEELAESHRTDPREKTIEKRWVPSGDGKWLWKRDASSDEVVGHMLGYGAYFDLAADADEKARVADQVDRVIGGIVDHGFVLEDIDGKATRWGNWSPESLNGDPNWHEERAGNSVEILSFLGIAYHMTGKEKYRAAAKRLVDEHGYVANMLQTLFNTPSERTHIEDELLSITYPNLLNHLIEPSLRKPAQTSMRRWHRTARPDGIPLYDFVYNRFSGTSVPLDAALEALRDWPLDMVEWTVDNSQREDVVMDRTPGRDPGYLTRILPRSEMGLCMFDQEPYRAVIGRGGDREDKPGDWLLSYWMGRYYGLIGPGERL
jgi:hypothetical protein